MPLRPAQSELLALAVHLDAADTIAAVACASGPGLRGLVRLSGPLAWPIALDGFMPDADLPAPDRPELRPGTLAISGLRRALPAAIALWPGPRTYTGQTLAEIHTIGSPPLLNLILADCLRRGARHAEPGEFTLRAFLSGRIDLTRAEAVLGVIDAGSPAQLEAALQQLAGGLAVPIDGLRERLLELLAHLEAGLDFVEESDVDAIGRMVLASELSEIADQIQVLAGRLNTRDRPEGLPRVVLIGPPNVGKSCLFNALLGSGRALVSPLAGTTRDYLSALCSCGDLTVELIDTAGIEEAASPIMVQAQCHRAEQEARADLLLLCRSHDCRAHLERVPDRPRLWVWTKCDEPQALAPPAQAIATSARNGCGLDRLKQSIAHALHSQASDGDLPASTSARCRDSLQGASTHLRSAVTTIHLGGGDELVAIDLRQALDELGKVVGAVVTDDILDRIFARFCIGK